MTLNHKKSKADWLVCECGNEPDLDGFFPCRVSGEMCEPDIDWDGYSYLCARCNRIYDIDEMREIGNAHPSAVEKNRKTMLGI